MRTDVELKNRSGRRCGKLSVSEIARRMNCSWITADKIVHPEKYPKKDSKRVYKSILDDYKDIIKQKVESFGSNAKGIWYLLKTKYEYKGSYETVKNYVRTFKKSAINNATIRFETSKGYQIQVDWKETLTLKSRFNVEYTINIFLMILGYSRYKYIQLTYDRKQQTLFECMTNAFEYFGGSTEEILFDNMKTVVDRAKSTYGNVVINEKFASFAKDAGFKVRCCIAFRPKTKGRVELLAKIMNRLKAFNGEFSNEYELEEIVKRLNEDINNELVQEVNIIPSERHKKETEFLTTINVDLLSTYYIKEKKYKVNKNSLISFHGKKYSVPPRFIGKEITVKFVDDSFIYLYYTTDFICSHNTTLDYAISYKKEHYTEILKTGDYKHLDNKKIEEIIWSNYEVDDNVFIDFTNEENVDYTEFNKEYNKQLNEFFEGVVNRDE